MNDTDQATLCPLCPLLTGNGYESLPRSERECGYPETRLYFLLIQLTMECHTGGVCQPAVIYPQMTTTEGLRIIQQKRFALHGLHRKAA